VGRGGPPGREREKGKERGSGGQFKNSRARSLRPLPPSPSSPFFFFFSTPSQFQASDVYDDLDDYDPLDDADDATMGGLFGGGGGGGRAAPECSPAPLGAGRPTPAALDALFTGGARPCDLRLSGLDAGADPATLPGDGKLDGVYRVAGCYAGRPLYVRSGGGGRGGAAAAAAAATPTKKDEGAAAKTTGAAAGGPTPPTAPAGPPGEDPDARVLWYSAAFRDWDLAAGSVPTEGDILAYGGSGTAREARPGRVPPGGWRLAADKASPGARETEAVAAGPANGDGYVRLDAVAITCADGSPDPGPAGAGGAAAVAAGTAKAAKAGGAPHGAPPPVASPAPPGGPLLTDAEMGAQYSAVYARARRARAAGRAAGGGGGASASAVGLALLGCAALVGLPLAAARAGRRRAPARPGRNLAGLGLGRRPAGGVGVAVAASAAVTAAAGDLAAEVAAALGSGGGMGGGGGGEKRSL